MKRLSVTCVALVAALALAAPVARAQGLQTGLLQGTVVDAGGSCSQAST